MDAAASLNDLPRATGVDALCDELLGYLRESDAWRARKLVLSALRQGIPSELVIAAILGPVLEKLGEGWEEHDVSLSQIYAAGRIAEQATELLLSRLTPGQESPVSIVTGTILGDHHGLGRRVLAAFLRSAGYRVVDVGLDVQAGTFVDAAMSEGARVIAASALMSNTALRTAEIDRELRRRGIRHQVRILVGGAPFRYNPGLVQAVGADATAPHAYEAVKVVRQILREAEHGR